MTDRGVSEALGFVLVFALIVSTIGMVYATGLGGLEGTRNVEKVQNVERAFDVLADNLEDLHRSGATSRATEIRLASGSISTGETVFIEVEAVEVGNPTNNATFVASINPITYRDDGGPAIHYVSGALLREESGGSVMLDQPRWVVSEGRSILPLVSTYSGSSSVAGSGTVLVVADRQSRSLNGPVEGTAGGAIRVNVTVTSDRAGAWGDYLRDQSMNPIDGDPADGNVTYQFETDSLFAPKTSVRVYFDR